MRITRQQAVVETLREMILQGEFPADARLFEIPLSEKLQVSRTPIRESLITLAEEGLVEYRPNRGYIVRRFTLESIMDAYLVRETLEALACRILAEKGISEEVKTQFKECLAEGDRILSSDRLTEAARGPWGVVNSRFHSLLMQNTCNIPLMEALTKVSNIPYASSRVVHWFEEGDDDGLFQLRAVHAQHHAIFRAICAREAYRAETAMRGHIDFAANHIRLKYATETQDKSRSAIDAAGPMIEQLDATVPASTHTGKPRRETSVPRDGFLNQPANRRNATST